MWRLRELMYKTTVEISGFGLEQLLCDAAAQGIKLSEIQRISYTRLTCKLAFFKLKKLASLSGNRTEIKTTSLCAIERVQVLAKKRPVLICGMLLMSILLFVANMFCFGVKIVGAKEINTFELRNYLEETVLFRNKNEIDISELELTVYEKFPELIFVNIRFAGTELVADLGEGKQPPELETIGKRSLTATRDGIVISSVVRAGQLEVAPGSFVKAGQVVISGDYVKKEKPITARAEGEVYAQTIYYGTAVAAYEFEQLTPTGRQTAARIMIIGKNTIFLEGENPFSIYTTEIKQSSDLGSNMPVSIKFQDVIFMEARKTVNRQKYEIAVLAAREKAFYDALSKVPENASLVRISWSEQPLRAGAYSKAAIVVIENIAG